LGLFAEVVVPKCEPIGAVVTLLIVISDQQGTVLFAQLLKDYVDGAAFEVGENLGQIVQGPVKPLPAAMCVFTFADMMGQILQEDGCFLSVFFGDRAGK